MRKLPSISVDEPVVVPVMITLAPTTNSPVFSSVILPAIFPVVPEIRIEQVEKRIRKIARERGVTTFIQDLTFCF
jgi:hypothetical protein